MKLSIIRTIFVWVTTLTCLVACGSSMGAPYMANADLSQLALLENNVGDHFQIRYTDNWIVVKNLRRSIFEFLITNDHDLMSNFLFEPELRLTGTDIVGGLAVISLSNYSNFDEDSTIEDVFDLLLLPSLKSSLVFNESSSTTFGERPAIIAEGKGFDNRDLYSFVLYLDSDKYAMGLFQTASGQMQSQLSTIEAVITSLTTIDETTAQYDTESTAYELPMLQSITSANTADLHQIAQIGRGFINDVAYSPDGTKLALAGSAGLILYDIDDLSAIPEILKGNTGALTSVSFSPDGSLIATGEQNGAVRLWDVRTSRQLVVLQEPSPCCRVFSVNSIAFSPDGSSVVVTTTFSTLAWNIDTGERVFFILATAEQQSALFTNGSSIIVSAGYNGLIRFNDIESEELLFALGDPYEDDINDMAYSPNGDIVAAAGTPYYAIRLWDIESQSVITELVGHNDFVKTITFSSDGSMIASGSNDNTVRLWDVETGELIRTFYGHDDMVKSVVFSPDDANITSLSRDGMVIIWNTNTGDQIDTIAYTTHFAHTDSINGLSYNVATNTLASGSSDTTVRLWNLETGQQSGVLEGNSPIATVALSPDSSNVAFATRETVDASGRLRIVDLTTSSDIYEEIVGNIGMGYLSYSTDSLILTTDLKLLHLESNESTFSVFKRIMTLAPDNNTYAAGSDPVRIVNVEDGQAISSFPTDAISIAFSDDGTLLATGSKDSTIKVWDIATQEQVAMFDKHTGAITDLKFLSNDSNLLVSSSVDGTAIVWDLNNNSPSAILDDHAAGVNSVVVTANNRLIVTGSTDGTIILWGVEQ